MRPTFLGFEAARSGLVASQKALDIVGNNIANMHTEGYTRQRVDLISMSTSNVSNRYASSNTSMSGQGVYITGVSQVRDPFLDSRYREQSAYLGNLDTTLTAYNDLQNLFDDVTSSGLQDGMSKLMSQLENLTTKPNQAEISSVVRTAAQNVAQMLSTYSNKLDNLAQQNQGNLEIGVQKVNSILEKLGALNAQIKEACLYNSTTDPISGERRLLGPYGPNELLDDRNLLLDQLSIYGEVSVKPESDGTSTVTFGGTVVLKDDDYEILNISQDTSGNNVLQWANSSKMFSSNFGAISACVDVIEGKGQYALTGENSAEGIAYYREIINSFANTFATKFNEANNVTVDGVAMGGDLFSKSNPADASFTAKNIRISDAWMSDSQFILMSTTDGKLENSNILKMVAMFDESQSFSSTTTNMDGTPTYTEFTGTFEGYLTHFENKLGNQKDYISGTYDSTASIANELLDMRDSVSAVSENEEAINMMKFQKSYNAAARLITVMDEALDTIINKMGRVGL